MDSSPLLDLDHESFDQSINRRIAEGNQSSLFDAFASLPDLVRTLHASAEDWPDLEVVLRNACAAAAIATRRGQPGLVSASLDALVAAYRLGDMRVDYPVDADAWLWEAASLSLFALGATAVKVGDFSTVRRVVVPQPVEGGHYASWLRHGQVMGARTTTEPREDNILDLAATVLATNSAFGQSEDSDEDRLRRLAEFDQLAFLVVADIRSEAGMAY